MTFKKGLVGPISGGERNPLRDSCYCFLGPTPPGLHLGSMVESSCGALVRFFSMRHFRVQGCMSFCDPILQFINCPDSHHSYSFFIAPPPCFSMLKQTPAVLSPDPCILSISLRKNFLYSSLVSMCDPKATHRVLPQFPFWAFPQGCVGLGWRRCQAIPGGRAF